MFLESTLSNMATVSAGLVNVNQLTVTGTQAGAIQASNLNIGNLDLSGNLGVGGQINCNSLEGKLEGLFVQTSTTEMNYISVYDLPNHDPTFMWNYVLEDKADIVTEILQMTPLLLLHRIL